MHRLATLACLALSLGCSPATVPPEITVSLSPAKISTDGKPSTITVQTTDELGKPGKGSVSVVSSAGSLTDGTTLTLDAQGTASTTVTCDVNADGACGSDVLIVTAKWKTASGQTVSTSFNSTLVAGSSTGTSCDGSALVGTWKRPDGFAWTLAASHCAITGTGDVATYHHSGSGTFNPATKTMSWAVTRVDSANNNCTSTMNEKITLVDPTHITIDCLSTSGQCGLPANYTESFTYTKQ